jgi:hypothetical protein
MSKPGTSDHRTFLQGENAKILANQITTVTANSS